MRKLPPFTLVFLLLSTRIVAAHEFWISPERYLIPQDRMIVAALRVGEDFKGPSFAYLPPQSARFDLVQGDRAVPVTSRIGDRPALNQGVDRPGLWIVVHETADHRLRYTDPQKFRNFANHKGFPAVLQQHKARGLPDDGFVELYRRYAKALVAVSDGAGADRRVGLRTEIVAGLNPYTDDLTNGLPVQVILDQAARADAQIEVFGRSAGKVTVETYRTDANGRAVITVAPDTEYLVNAVKMLPLEPDAPEDPVWMSLWASMTFKTP